MTLENVINNLNKTARDYQKLGDNIIIHNKIIGKSHFHKTLYELEITRSFEIKNYDKEDENEDDEWDE
jgi:hypothetical protein